MFCAIVNKEEMGMIWIKGAAILFGVITFVDNTSLQLWRQDTKVVYLFYIDLHYLDWYSWNSSTVQVRS